ncbi:hypothetical protein FKP32DRAFT_649333 [Trametes sanguinea]|nr:hypothetical protein FKP32DRAFT_649333 [Trametes sanguinea]
MAAFVESLTARPGDAHDDQHRSKRTAQDGAWVSLRSAAAAPSNARAAVRQICRGQTEGCPARSHSALSSSPSRPSRVSSARVLRLITAISHACTTSGVCCGRADAGPGYISVQRTGPSHALIVEGSTQGIWLDWAYLGRCTYRSHSFLFVASRQCTGGS